MSEVEPTPAPTPAAPSPKPAVAAGWYDDGSGRQRWYDGVQWTDHFAPTQQHTAGPMTAGSLNVKREVSYVRQQEGHSLILHAFVIGWFCLWINVIYISVSPNHYWHA